MASMSLKNTIQIIVYMLLLLLSLLGNAIVIVVIGESVFKKNTGGGRNSDIIIINMAFSNLLMSLLRNTLLAISDFGFQLYSSKTWCRTLMGVWVWIRSANVWSTLYLSAFHFQTLRRVSPQAMSVHGIRGSSRYLFLNIGFIWIVSLIYAIPAHIFSINGSKNSTETLMLVSSTTRTLLGCVWNFPSSYSGLAYATTSLVIHELIPIVFMLVTNLGSLSVLYTHSRVRTAVQDAPLIKRAPAERRAAKVILALIVLFIISWGTSVFTVNYFNYRQSSVEYLLVVARYSNILFNAFSPVVLAVGHRRMRTFFKSMLNNTLTLVCWAYLSFNILEEHKSPK